MFKICPVRYVEFVRYMTASEISDGFPVRFKGVALTAFDRVTDVSLLAHIIAPGAIQFTRIFGASSIAKERVNAFSAALDIQ